MWGMRKVWPSVIPVIILPLKHSEYSDRFVQEQTFPTGLPRVPGHEIIGTVAAVPPNEPLYKVGERVGAGWHGGHCFDCDMCLEGNFSQCRKQVVNGKETSIPIIDSDLTR